MSVQILEISCFSPSRLIMPFAPNSFTLSVCVTNSTFIESSYVNSSFVCVLVIPSLNSGMSLLMSSDMTPIRQRILGGLTGLHHIPRTLAQAALSSLGRRKSPHPLGAVGSRLPSLWSHSWFSCLHPGFPHAAPLPWSLPSSDPSQSLLLSGGQSSSLWPSTCASSLSPWETLLHSFS